MKQYHPLGGWPRATGKLDPQIETYLQEARSLPAFQDLTPQETRKIRNAFIKKWAEPPEPVEKVENLSASGPGGLIPIRLYTPQGLAPFPVLVYFHGGGWLLGNLDTQDSLCRAFANRAQCIVASVDYRLAPEHKFPAAVEDAYAATQWISKNTVWINGDPKRVAVGGDSSGGNLAAVVSLIARDRKEPALVFQLLVYPVTDLTSFATNSYKENGDKYTLTKDGMEYFRRHYLKQEEDARNPYASPLLAEDLSDLPPALVIAAECDVLTDEVRAYAHRLREAEVSVTYICYKGVIHGFFHLGSTVDRSKEAVNKAASILRAVFAG